MTWPFENDTSGIVKRISNRSISANRKRNIFIILTIALASALLSAIVLYGFGVMQETQNRNQKTAQIMYHAISEQQGQELYKQEEIAWVGEFFNAFSEQVNHSTVNFTYANADMLKSQSMPYSGAVSYTHLVCGMAASMASFSFAFQLLPFFCASHSA